MKTKREAFEAGFRADNAVAGIPIDSMKWEVEVDWAWREANGIPQPFSSPFWEAVSRLANLRGSNVAATKKKPRNS